MIPVYATLPTLGRPCLTDCLNALLPQTVRHAWIVNTGPEELPVRRWLNATVIDAADSPRNISAWWNLGIRAAAKDAAENGYKAWDVLVVNDDVIVPPDLVAKLSDGLRSSWDRPLPALAYPDQDGYGWHLATDHRDPAVMTGYCFMLRGELGLEVDERLKWWYSDNFIDLTARARGGSIRVPGCRVNHLFPSGYTVASAELSAQTHLDRAEFERIYREEGF